jgi:hypothetical protein
MIYNRAMRAYLGLAFALAACGKTTNLTDAGHGDGNGADSGSLVDADLRGPVTVTVYATDGTTTPVENAQVVFVEPNGSIEATVPTNAQGVATANVLAGASVTAVYPTDPDFHHQLETVLGVKPGDAIAIGPIGDPPHGAPTGTFTMNVPDNGAASYAVYGPCGGLTQSAAGSGSPTAVPIDLYDDCKQSTMDVIAIANGGSGAFAWVEKNGVAYTNGGSDTMGSGWQPFHTVTATYTDVPVSDVVSISLIDSAPDTFGYLRSSYVPTTTATTTTSVQTVGAAHALITTQLSNDGQGRQDIYEVVDGTKTDYGLDVGASLLPWLDVPQLDVAGGKITVAQSGTSTLTPDLYDTFVDYQRTGTTTTVSFEWEILGPTPGDMAFPPLPASLSENVPLATDTVTFAWGMILDADAITSYDQIRGSLFQGLEAYFQGRGTTGQLRTSSGQTNLGFTSLLQPRRR